MTDDEANLLCRTDSSITKDNSNGGVRVSWAVHYIDIPLIISASLITWCWTAARLRSRAHAQALASRRERAELLARMTHMQDVAIRAMAALRAGVASQTEAGEAASAK